MKEKGFRLKVICWLIAAFFYVIGILVFILWLMVEVISMFLYIPELFISFVISIFRDRWSALKLRWLEEISSRLWDVIQNLGNKAREYGP